MSCDVGEMTERLENEQSCNGSALARKARGFNSRSRIEFFFFQFHKLLWTVNIKDIQLYVHKSHFSVHLKFKIYLYPKVP